MTERKEKFERCLFWLLLLLGALLRLWEVGSMPGGMHQDESFVAWNAYAILHEGMDSAGHVFPIYMADWGDGHSALYVWLLIPLLALNGGHVTPFLARLPQVATAICTLPAVYGILKRTVDRQAALWGMFLLAICPWHIMMSRWGLDANLAPGFLMFGLLFFLVGVEKKHFLLLSAFFYGLSLYSYAVIWPIVFVMLLLQIGYGLLYRKLRIDRWSLSAALILFVMAVPLLLFILVNSDVLPEICLPFMTIPKMSGYRGGEVAFGISGMWNNLRTALSLLWHQNTGAPYDILLPWGLFYDIGRVFMIFGACCLIGRVLVGFLRREFRQETFLLIQLMGGGITCLLVTAVLHQINALYIPLVLCEAYGVWSLWEGVRKNKAACAGKTVIARVGAAVTAAAYLICLIGFQRDYYTGYRQQVNAYFGAGIRECVEYALDLCGRTELDTITVEKGAQWPRLLLYTETLPSEYLESVVYDVAPAPAGFVTNGILVRTRIRYDEISQESIYIIYYTDKEQFKENFELKPFYDWYVAVPRQYAELVSI